MNHATQDFIRPGYETQPIPDLPMPPATGRAKMPRNRPVRKA